MAILQRVTKVLIKKGRLQRLAHYLHRKGVRSARGRQQESGRRPGKPTPGLQWEAKAPIALRHSSNN
ncbi:hypothetical protein THICB2_240017 [Thiomonas sp. CB2]|nr:hypothetical protein THICB2_240017 [Thiomonas sp. CB2]